MQRAHGTFKGTAAAITLGLGFEPDYIKVYNKTDLTELEWWFGDYTNRYGVTRAAAGDKAQAGSAAAGIIPYAGGGPLSAASTQYLVRNEADQRGVDVAAGSEVTTFTVTTAGSYQGKFNCDVTGATIGVGSRITFDGEPDVYWITALTAGQGISDDEVTLNAIPSGKSVFTVSKIWSRWDYTGAAQNAMVPKGVTIGASATVIDTDGDVCEFDAISFSN